MNQRYNDNMKSPKLQDAQQEILQLGAFCQKIQQRPHFQETALVELPIMS